MASDDDWIDKHRARIKALREQLDRDEAELEAAASETAGQRKGNALRDAAFLVGISVVSAVLVLSGMTLVGMGGRDFGDADRAGWASVRHCWKHGPVTGKGFGFWETCNVTIRWDNGPVEGLTKDDVFFSADIGREVRVGDLGRHRTSRELAREDTAYRPWFTWIGVLVTLTGALPGLWAVLVFREYLRKPFRFRRR